MSADAGARHRLLLVDAGEGRDLCVMLMERLGVPRTAQWFEVRFELGQVVKVLCAYLPESAAEQQKVEAERK